MKKLTILLFLILNIGVISSCDNKSSKKNTKSSYFNSLSSYETEYNEDGRDENGKDEYGHIEDGIYTAIVDYYNPATNYYATYTLDVEVVSGKVTVIYFPNDGYLDDDHIYPSELDDRGYVSINGEEGKTYGVQIDL